MSQTINWRLVFLLLNVCFYLRVWTFLMEQTVKKMKSDVKGNIEETRSMRCKKNSSLFFSSFFFFFFFFFFSFLLLFFVFDFSIGSTKEHIHSASESSSIGHRCRMSSKRLTRLQHLLLISCKEENENIGDVQCLTGYVIVLGGKGPFKRATFAFEWCSAIWSMIICLFHTIYQTKWFFLHAWSEHSFRWIFIADIEIEKLHHVQSHLAWARKSKGESFRTSSSCELEQRAACSCWSGLNFQ